MNPQIQPTDQLDESSNDISQTPHPEVDR